MQFRDAMVVTIKKREKIFGEIALVTRAQGSDDAEIDRSILGLVRVGHDDKNIAWVHVGVKEVVAKHLGEENFYAVFRQQLNISAGCS